jgi:RHS repeat-associated protein
LGRLTKESETANGETLTKAYEYDKAGNRDVMTVSGSENYTTDYTYDLNNRLKTEVKDKIATVETAEYKYDKNGNQISKTTFTTGIAGGSEEIGVYLLGSNRPVPREDYTVEINKFDGFNRLVQVQNDEGTSVYLYKADGLRLSKEVNGALTNHVWDGQNIVLEYGAINDVYLRGINLIKSNVQGYYLFNAHGDVVQRTDGSGGIVKSYIFDAFGVEKDIDEGDTNPFRYCAEYFDQETGSIYLRARYYDPSVGGFMSEDPIRDGLNWYTYCMGNPVCFIDPTGLKVYSFKNIFKPYYELYVSEQWQDAGSSGIGTAFSAYGPGYGLGYSMGMDISLSLVGFSEIEYDPSDFFSAFSDTVADMGTTTDILSIVLKDNPIVRGASAVMSYAVPAVDLGGYLKDWFIDHQYQIEEAVYNHFDRYAFHSDTKEIIDGKFKYAIENMMQLMLEGKVDVRKAVDIFGSDAFSYNGSLSAWTSYQTDPFTGEKKFFRQDKYYFNILDECAKGSIAEIEKTLKGE